jgi:hypothetical protein
MPILKKSKPTGRSSATAKRPQRKSSGSLQIGAGQSPRTEKSFSVPVQFKTLQVLAGHPLQTGELIEKYGAALQKSRRMGRDVSFVVHVGPEGEPHFGKVETASSHQTTLTKVEVGSDLQEALKAARERGRTRVADILSSADMLSAEQFGKLIGTSRVTVNAKRQLHQILGLDGAKRGFRFPEWQIGDDGKPFSALPELFDRLGGSAWAVYRFLVQVHPELDGKSGREALARGRSAETLEAAESVMRAAS